MNEVWTKRVIIPIYKDRRLIYYQGRSLVPAKLKYKSPGENKDCVLYGFDQVYAHVESPLYITEGFFDAFMVDGVGTLGNKLTKAQIAHLTRSRRPKVIIPDKTGNGDVMAKQGLKLGWAISTPDIGNCKDINSAVKRYGKLYVMQSIIENTRTEFEAEMALALYCGKDDGD